MDVRASAEAEYDSNVANASDAQASSQGIQPEDVVYTPQVSANLVMPIGRQALFLQGSASYLYHQNNHQLDHDRINVLAGLGGSVGPCGAVVSGAYATGRAQLADQALVTDVENVLSVETGTVGLTCARPSGLGFVANSSYSHASNSALQLTNSDFDSTTVSAGVSYSRPSSGSISLLGDYSRGTYPHRLDIDGQSSGYESRGASVQVTRRLGGKIQLGATIGYTDVTPMSSSPVAAGGLSTPVADFKGLVYSGDAKFRASSRLQASLTFSRQVQPSLITGQSYEVQSAYALGVDYSIGSRITAHAGAQLSESAAHGGLIIDPALSLTNSKVTILLASLRYQQSKRLSLLLNAQHEQRTADNARFSYEGYRVGVTAGVNF